MTQGEIEALSREIERNARNLEIDIMLDIVRRIKSNLDIEQSMTSSADYQIQLLRKMGYSDEFLKNEIKSYLKFSDERLTGSTTRQARTSIKSMKMHLMLLERNKPRSESIRRSNR